MSDDGYWWDLSYLIQHVSLTGSRPDAKGERSGLEVYGGWGGVHGDEKKRHISRIRNTVYRNLASHTDTEQNILCIIVVRARNVLESELIIISVSAETPHHSQSASPSSSPFLWPQSSQIQPHPGQGVGTFSSISETRGEWYRLVPPIHTTASPTHTPMKRRNCRGLPIVPNVPLSATRGGKAGSVVWLL